MDLPSLGHAVVVNNLATVLPHTSADVQTFAKVLESMGFIAQVCEDCDVTVSSGIKHPGFSQTHKNGYRVFLYWISIISRISRTRISQVWRKVIERFSVSSTHMALQCNGYDSWLRINRLWVQIQEFLFLASTDVIGQHFKTADLIGLILSIGLAQLKQSWKYWHSCIRESLWKTLRVKPKNGAWSS